MQKLGTSRTKQAKYNIKLKKSNLFLKNNFAKIDQNSCKYTQIELNSQNKKLVKLQYEIDWNIAQI